MRQAEEVVCTKMRRGREQQEWHEQEAGQREEESSTQAYMPVQQREWQEGRQVSHHREKEQENAMS